MSELPPGVEIVEIDDKDYDWTPCPTCKQARWWWTTNRRRRNSIAGHDRRGMMPGHNLTDHPARARILRPLAVRVMHRARAGF